MARRRDAIVLSLVLFGLVIIAFLMRPAGAGSGSDPRVSSYLTGPHGAAALYMLLEELDIDVRRQLQPWSADSSRLALVVLAPTQPVTPREMEAVRDWIENGGTLILATGERSGIRRMLGLELHALLPDTLGPLETVRWSGVSSVPTGHPWTAGIDSIAGFTRAFSSTSSALRESQADVLLRTRDGEPTVVAFGVGEGRVIAWSDAAVLGNSALRDGDAALLFARAAAAVSRTDGGLRFDEYHHGYREASPVRALGAVLTGTGGGRAVLQAAVACVALLLLFGARFGAPVREHRERRRSPLEHVQALAGAYHRADAQPAARRLLLAGMERRLGRRVLGATGALPAAALDATPAGRRLKQEWERGTEGELADLASAVDDFVLEVRRWK